MLSPSPCGARAVGSWPRPGAHAPRAAPLPLPPPAAPAGRRAAAPPAAAPMWRFHSASGSAPVHGDKLFSLNGHQGRQTWEFDADAGTPEERARVEELRAAFAANRHTQKHRWGRLWGRRGFGAAAAAAAWAVGGPRGAWGGGRHAAAAAAPPVCRGGPPGRASKIDPPPPPPNSHPHPDSADELLRLQVAAKVAAKKHAPPAAPLPEGEPVTAERVDAHLKVGGGGGGGQALGSGSSQQQQRRRRARAAAGPREAAGSGRGPVAGAAARHRAASQPPNLALTPPPTPPPQGAVSFYECLQADDGHFPGEPTAWGPLCRWPAALARRAAPQPAAGAPVRRRGRTPAARRAARCPGCGLPAPPLPPTPHPHPHPPPPPQVTTAAPCS
jgi:hypothetical protein